MLDSKYKALSFDCYGTLVDWEAGILTELQAWAQRQGVDVSDVKLIELFGTHERAVQEETPRILYPSGLAEVHHRVAQALGVVSTEDDARSFGASVGTWPLFPDTLDALKALSASYDLFILSNVDRKSFSASNAKMGIVFRGIVTAEDVGSYKPDARNFEALKQCVSEAGIATEALLHVSESIYHDVIPAHRAGLETAWIDRHIDNPNVLRASGALDQNVKPTMTFSSLALFAEAATKS